MYNLIKMDVYRLMKTKAFWVIFVLTAAMPILDITLMSTFAEAGAPATLSVDTIIENMLQSKIIILYCSVFIPIYVIAESKNGFVKNIAGQLPNRGTLALSKMVTAALGTLFLFICLIISCIASGTVYYGNLLLGSVNDMMVLIAIQFLLHAAFSCLIVYLSLLTLSSSFSMTVGIIISGGMFSILYLAINKLVSLAVGSVSGFDIGNYMLEKNISAIGIDSTGNMLLKASLIGCLFLVASIISSVILIKKRDIR